MSTNVTKALLDSGEVDAVLMTGYFGGYSQYSRSSLSGRSRRRTPLLFAPAAGRSPRRCTPPSRRRTPCAKAVCRRFARSRRRPRLWWRYTALAHRIRRRLGGVHRLGDQRPAAGANGGGDGMRHLDLPLEELLRVLAVPAEVAGHEHRIDLAGVEQCLGDVRVRHEVLLAAAGEVDRVAGGRGGRQVGRDRGREPRAQHRQLQPGSVDLITGDRAVTAAVADDRDPARRRGAAAAAAPGRDRSARWASAPGAHPRPCTRPRPPRCR